MAGGGPSGAGADMMRPDAPVPDWDALRAAAVQAAAWAYAPYSRLHVGAAALVDDGRVVTGCNVENASYGLGVCAEVTLAGQLRLSGGGRLLAVACRSGDGDLLMPCGRCRQVLHEFGGATLLCDTPRGVLPFTEVLPDAFGPEDLP
ncbi:Cytidine deaminase [Pseudonocardia sp. Ae406_Ps2]|nr:Cytidine deaminase [Pseudonocardia sp. Ae331_Ps2]OLM04767.1 Cytidine deaminase [Pseudonocardia sp. Ae406_Ps2]OLM10408.1 Cytidine deaminase [Pseudonocardia sp. Ae505_Ps2]OLM26335.1 Cytidine deaminase [Pseudonocardia sp. Ae706_Ps2]OLM33573.1 Cytidine deaminase [Pseudonocardia sp. Ae717_Ps2]